MDKRNWHLFRIFNFQVPKNRDDDLSMDTYRQKRYNPFRSQLYHLYRQPKLPTKRQSRIILGKRRHRPGRIDYRLIRLIRPF